MQRIVRLKSDVLFTSYSAVGGGEESRGRYGKRFDLCDKSDMFGMPTFELAEGEMGRCAMNLALGKAGLSHDDIDLLVAGDLQNQCSASSVGLNSFGVPFLGIYGACSTCTEGLLIAATMMEADPAKLVHRNSFNIASMSFTPEIICEAVKRRLPDFTMDYNVDPVKEQIARSWPNQLDDSCARDEWGWNPEWDLERMTDDMLEHIREKVAKGLY